jgi:hypothetical protein
MRPTTRLTGVWLLLSALTVLSWWLGGGTHARPARDVVVTFAVVGLGLVKVRLVVRHFMEVRTAPAWLRHGTDAWLVALGVSVLALYLV